MNGVDRVSGQVVDAAVKLHMRLGPGLMESVYVGVLAQELVRRGLSVQQQKSLRFEIDGVVFQRALRPDLVVDGVVVVEVKSVEVLAPVHSKQLLTYLRCLGLSVGLLLNFGAPTMKQGCCAWSMIIASIGPAASHRHDQQPRVDRSAASPSS